MNNLFENTLGIGVASFQQNQELLDTVQNLSEVQKYLSSRGITIPTIISDNASADFPESRIEQILIGNPNNIIVKHPKNLGFNGNLSYLLSNVPSKYVIVIGCGEKIIPNALEELYFHLQEVEMLKIPILGGTLCDANLQISVMETFTIDESNLIINPSISLNVWNRAFLTDTILRKERQNTWPHIELAIEVGEHFRGGKYFYFGKKTIILSQGEHGWHNSDYFLEILLKHDDLVRRFRHLNLGSRVIDNYVAVGSWIYYFRRSRDRALPTKSLINLTTRLLKNPIALLYIVCMAYLPTSSIRFFSKLRRKLRWT